MYYIYIYIYIHIYVTKPAALRFPTSLAPACAPEAAISTPSSTLTDLYPFSMIMASVLFVQLKLTEIIHHKTRCQESFWL